MRVKMAARASGVLRSSRRASQKASWASSRRLRGSMASFQVPWPAGRGVLLHALAEDADALQGVLGGLQALEAEVVEPAVVVALDGEAEGDGIEALVHEVAQGVEVAQALGHLLAFHQQELAVDPEVHPGVVQAALALGDLVLVVGEDEVHAAAVDVDALAQELHAHGRALDVPAGAARSPGALPGGLAGLGGLPEHEVGDGIPLVLVGVDTGCPAFMPSRSRWARQP